jgi:putative ABC transport system substrate-binding protein
MTARLAQYFKPATETIPIVVFGGNPVAFRLVPRLARPGGNITGVVVDAGVELEGKRLALLRESFPEASRLAYLASWTVWDSP